MNTGRILIADDDAGTLAALQLRLRSWGYEVDTCRDGVSAIEKSRAVVPAAIVLDHEMPAGDGRSVARSIRTQCAAPIIFVSGHSRDDFRETVLQTPDSYFIGKPLDMARLQRLLEAVIEPPAEPLVQARAAAEAPKG